MAEPGPGSDHPEERGREDRGVSRQPGEAPRPGEIPVGVQVLRIPEEIALEIGRLGEAGLKSLVGTRVWLEPRKGQLFLHLGDVDRDPIDP